MQEQIYWTDFLRDYIRARDLEKPVHLGRIWRIVHTTTKRDRPPALSKAPAADLVKALSHPNGWWRDTAQRLMVERGDATVVPQLKQLAAQAADWRTRLHALWTLDGLDAIAVEEVQRALGDKSPEVRAAAVRLSERWIGQANHPLAPAVIKLLDDSSWTVRRQVAATAGELPPPAQADTALAALSRYGADPITVDAAVSGLRGIEADVLARVHAAPKHDPRRGVDAGRCGREERQRRRRSSSWLPGDRYRHRARPIRPPCCRGSISDCRRRRVAAAAGGRRRRRTRRGRHRRARSRLQAEPAALTALAAQNTETGGARQAHRREARLAEQARAGRRGARRSRPRNRSGSPPARRSTRASASGCHQPDGRGKEKIAPLAGGVAVYIRA